MKSISTIRKHEKELRTLIDNSKRDTRQEIIESRLAYIVEQTLFWVRNKTVGWESRLEDVKTNAKILANELKGVEK